MGTKERLLALIDRLDDQQETEAFAYLSQMVDGAEGNGSPARQSDDVATESTIVSGRDFVAAPQIDWQAVAAEQGVRPLGNLREVIGDFWPEDESVDDFIATVRGWRSEGGRA